MEGESDKNAPHPCRHSLFGRRRRACALLRFSGPRTGACRIHSAALPAAWNSRIATCHVGGPTVAFNDRSPAAPAVPYRDAGAVLMSGQITRQADCRHRCSPGAALSVRRGEDLRRLEATEMISATRVLAAIGLPVAVLTFSSASAGVQNAALGDSRGLGLDAEARSPRPQVQTPRPIRTADRCTRSCRFIFRRCQAYGNSASYCQSNYESCMSGC
jgi:hypothetical protein